MLLAGLLCCYHGGERQHADAVTFFGAAPTQLTHNLALAEFAPCFVRGLKRAEALTFVSELLDSPAVEVVWVDELLHRAAIAFLQSRTDKTYSLCNAVSFLSMWQRGIREALTTDRHFEQEGFGRLLS
jgi:predicted nucleic acid-binding protein